APSVFSAARAIDVATSPAPTTNPTHRRPLMRDLHCVMDEDQTQVVGLIGEEGSASTSLIERHSSRSRRSRPASGGRVGIALVARVVIVVGRRYREERVRLTWTARRRDSRGCGYGVGVSVSAGFRTGADSA